MLLAVKMNIIITTFVTVFLTTTEMDLTLVLPNLHVQKMNTTIITLAIVFQTITEMELMIVLLNQLVVLMNKITITHVNVL